MFYKKSCAKVGKAYKWFPRAYVLRKPVDTQMLGEAISQRCTVSPADVHAVLRALPEVMAGYMEAGRSIHMDGLGAFYYKLSCAGELIPPKKLARNKFNRYAYNSSLPVRKVFRVIYAHS